MRVSPARSRQRAEVHVTQSTPLTYRDAGVDIDAGNEVVERIKPLVRRTLRPEVLGGVGLFGGLFDLSNRYREPVLVSGTDGVGTKLILAKQLDRHDSIGQDLVAMCVNDVLVQGAEPLFFLDYFATGKLDVDTTVAVVGGIARGCELSGCALIGGETAEMPDMYGPGEYDLAGFCVAAVEKSRLLDGAKVRAGDVLIGIASSGPHSNGYSLVRRIYDRAGRPADLDVGGVKLADALMAPTTLYVKPILELLQAHDLHGMAHITGGGLTAARRRGGEHRDVAHLQLRHRLRAGGGTRPAGRRAGRPGTPATGALADRRSRHRRGRRTRPHRLIAACRAARRSPSG